MHAIAENAANTGRLMAMLGDFAYFLTQPWCVLKARKLPADALSACVVATHQPWFNQRLTTVNDAVVRLGIFRGEFPWHKHDEQDEFFLVPDGEIYLDTEQNGSVHHRRRDARLHARRNSTRLRVHDKPARRRRDLDRRQARRNRRHKTVTTFIR
jgi:hypothetical protein